MTVTDLGTSPHAGPGWSADELESALALQRKAGLTAGPPSAEERRQRLDRLLAVLLSSADELVDAINLDFGNRPAAATLAGEIATSVQDIMSLRRNLGRWMKHRRPQPRYFRLAGIRAWVEPSPLGVVGVISPWNFPVALSMQPVAAAIAAGNTVMLKMSEITPHTAEVMRRAVANHFAPEEFVVVTGGPEVGARFSALAWDHLFFTGAPTVGSQVAQTAAAQLVPVTLELGGKNPTVVAEDADVAQAAERIARARLANSGQICLSPDYVFVPRHREDQFLDAAESAFQKSVPTVLHNADYCSIVSDRHYERITALIDDARAKGAHVREAIPSDERFPSPSTRRIPPTLLHRVTDDMRVMHEEVFGPVLTILPYDSVEDVVQYINQRPTPLAVYWFGNDSADFRSFTARTRSGGVTRNDFALHSAVAGLPFGGVGRSGTGYYHGRYGFDTFSHLRAVAVSPQLYSPVALLSPPFSPRFTATLRRTLRLLNARTRRRISNAAKHQPRGTK